MTDKELNSHDLAREIEIVKLQEEIEELKSQLRGTTHCFDEEEHKQLKERIAYLERSIERKEETITGLEQERVPYTNDYVEKIKKENEELKKQREEYKRLGFKHLQDKNNKLEHNWNQLKKFLELRLHENCNLSMYGVVQIRQEIEKAILKMQELERGVSDDEYFEDYDTEDLIDKYQEYTKNEDLGENKDE